jgi:hypothetical protein
MGIMGEVADDKLLPVRPQPGRRVPGTTVRVFTPPVAWPGTDGRLM